MFVSPLAAAVLSMEREGHSRHPDQAPVRDPPGLAPGPGPTIPQAERDLWLPQGSELA